MSSRAAGNPGTAAPASSAPAHDSKAARTPLMRQYLRVKEAHPDAFLFFRLGDFYEMFFEDAVRGARLLGLTLTSRNKHDPQPIPMCGIPWHQRDGYVGRLLRLGHKVAICDQLEEPSAAKALVDRGVTEILTPGSVTAEQFLDPAANNFLAALWVGADAVGICVADASTGEVRLAQPTWDEAAAMLPRLRVAEWLTPAATERDGAPPAAVERLEDLLRGLAGARSPLPAARFLEAPDPRQRWDAAAAEAVADLDLARVAAAGALDYFDRMQGGLARQFTRVERWSEDEVMRYDAATARHLELFQPQPGGESAHTLWHVVDRCVTALGARRLRSWLERPLARLEPLRRRHDAVEAWWAAAGPRSALRESLQTLADLERLAARLACGKATPRELGNLRTALGRVPAIRGAVEQLGAAEMESARDALAGLPELAQHLDALVDDPPPTSREGGIIRPGRDAHRDELDDLAHSGKRWIAELESAERARTGIPSLKVGFNRVFGYYLEVTKVHLDKVPADWERRQTLAAAERFVTPALKVKEGEVLSAEERLKAREHELFVAVRESAARYVPQLQRIADAIARIDAESTLAEIAAQHAWVRPEVDESDRLVLEDARHPVVEQLLPRGEFVPNGCDLDGTRRQILLLTGPNMGGKSTYLRQVALAVLLAQAGSFVPAARARIGLVDRLFTRVGAADRLGSGQSTFMVEMSETADIMRSATPRSLVVLDEVGRGTATYDGLALAWAVTEHLHAAGGPRPRTLFATHYHELTQLAEQLPRLVNVHVLVKEWEDQVVFLHRIAEGAADRSYGIHVAQLAGLPLPVIERARQVLHELESERTAEHLGSSAPKSSQRLGRGAGEAANEAQLPLFGATRHPLQDELDQIEPDTLTPLEALQRLSHWKRRWSAS